jgi:hypothetical protein
MNEIEKLISRIEKLKLQHDVCEDSFYSCPMSSEGCSNDAQIGCTCGAKKHNAELDDIIKWIRSEIIAIAVSDDSEHINGMKPSFVIFDEFRSLPDASGYELQKRKNKAPVRRDWSF